MVRLIRKYALWLSVSYGIEFLIMRFLTGYNLGLDWYDESTFQISLYGLITLLNVVMILVIKKDKDKFQVRTQYVYLATILYRPLGVCAFLLYMLYNEQPLKQNTQKVS